MSDRQFKVVPSGSQPINPLQYVETVDLFNPDGSPYAPAGGGAVASVAGRTGAVVLSTTDVTGLGTAATQPSSAFDSAGAASAAQSAAASDATAKVATETSRATTAEGTLTTNVAANATAIGNEVTRAIAAEATKATSPDLLAVSTVPTALTVNKIQPFNATAGAITATALPALSGLAVGTTYWVQKTDATANTVTVPYAAGDLSDTGASSAVVSIAETNALQVVTNPAGGKLWKAVASIKPTATLDARYAASAVALRKRRNVTGRCAIPSATRNVTNTGGTNTQMQQLSSFVLTTDVEDLSFTYQNAYCSSATATQIGGLSAVTIKTSLSDGVNNFPLFWENGSRSITLDPGGIASTAPIPVRAAKGQRMWITRLMTWATAPSVFPAGTVYANSATEVSEWGTALTDRTSGTSLSQFYTRNGGPWAVLPPMAITATASRTGPVVGILGDSIASDGSLSYTTDDMDYGWAQGGLADAGIPYVSFGQSSLTLATITASPALRSQLFQSLGRSGVTHLLVALATNDFASLLTAAQIYTGMTLLQTELTPLGIQVIPVTCQPRTNSTNTGAQSGETNTFAQRTLLNNTIIANKGTGFGYFDLAGALQDSGGNLWRTDIRGSGSIAITNGGSGYAQNDTLILPYGGIVEVTAVSSGVITSISSSVGLGGWIGTDPSAAVAPVRQYAGAWRNPAVCSGTGATFTYSSITNQTPTADGIHPQNAATTYLRQLFGTAAPTLFTVA